MNEHNKKIKEQISAYLDGELSQEETSRVEDLILNNKQWQQYYKELQGLSELLTGWEDETVSPDLTSKVQKSLLEQKLKEDIMKKKPSFVKRAAPALTIATCVLVGLVALKVYVDRGMEGRRMQQYDGPVPVDEMISQLKDKERIAGRLEVRSTEEQIAAEGKLANRERKGLFFKGNKPAEKAKARKAQVVKTVTEGQSRDTFSGGATSNRIFSNEKIAETAQYEPYSLDSNYAVGDKKESGAATLDAVIVQAPRVDGPARQESKRDRAKALNKQMPATEAVPSRAIGGFQRSDYGATFGDYSSSVEPEKNRQIYRGGRMPYEDDDEIGRHYRPERSSFNTENYNRIYENEFLNVADNPLSTFSIDVDTASYANVRRFLNKGQLPPKDAVRIEEMVNYFTYNYPEPRREHPFSVTIKASPAPWRPDHQLVLIGLQGKTLKSNEIPPSNLVFLIDVSGSMNQPNKLPLLKEAFKMMVNQLGPNERVAIVVYAGAAGEVLPSTSGANKQAILGAIDRLSAGGSTAGGAGIKLAYQIAKQNFIPGGNNRVILATDGDFNVGVSNDADLTRIIEKKRQDGVFLTTLGFGTGNYKDSRMEQLANKGNGNHYYIDTHNEARKVLVRELGSTLFTIAKDVKLQIEFNPQQVKAYRLIGYENRMLAKEDFNDDTKDAGELGAGHTVTALYELVLGETHEGDTKVDPLKYVKSHILPSEELLTVKLRYKKPNEHKSKLIQESIRMRDISVQPDADFTFAAAVAEFGLVLRDSKFKSNANLHHVVQKAQEARGSDPFGYRSEFISLVENAKRLIPQGYMEFKNQEEDYPVSPHSQGGMFFKGNVTVPTAL